MVDEVRRRTTAAHRLRRGRKMRSGVDQPAPAAARAPNDSPTSNAPSCSSSSPRADPNGDIAAAWIAKELLRDVLACTARGGLRYEISAALYAFYTFCAACSVPEIQSARRNDLNLAGANDPRHPDRPVQRPQRGLQPDRQTRRPHRIRLQNTRESTPPSTVGLHPPITASAIQHQTAAPLLTRKSPICRCRSTCGWHPGEDLRLLAAVPPRPSGIRPRLARWLGRSAAR